MLINIEAYSYHTSSRFSGRVRVSVENGLITITGPRMGDLLFRLWLLFQGCLFILTMLTLVAGLVFLETLYSLIAVSFFFLHVFGCMLGTAIWELMNLFGHESATFHIEDVNGYTEDFKWYKYLENLLIPLYFIFITRISPGRIVSFEVHEKETTSHEVYSLMLWDDVNANTLKSLLASCVLT